jgi:hypothetical protein
VKLKVFTTSRQIRRWLETRNDQFLDKYYTIGEFFSKIVVVDERKFIDSTLRKSYLFNSLKEIDVSKLGISSEFVHFFKDSNFIFSFFNELFLERSSINDVLLNDIYLDFKDHLTTLKEIKENYKKLLEADGYIDRFLIEEFKINKGLLEGVEKIEIYLEGYLSKFDLEILKKIDLPIEIFFTVDRFNKPLLKKSFGDLRLENGVRYCLNFNNNELKELERVERNLNVTVAYFSERFLQIDFVFAKIAEFVEMGIKPDRVAVVLPDESFSEYLKIFDKYKNLNFAMGESFTKSDLFIKLKAIYEYEVNQSDTALKKCNDWIEEYKKSEVLEFIRQKATNKELKVIDEELYKIEKFKDFFNDKDQFLYFVLERFKEYRFDDAYSGKITSLGVLESRGVEFDAVIIVDFNDSFVPNVDENDLFLNSFIREKSNLPTKRDKENLQKHYYYQLINSSKICAISYVKNDESSASRFLHQLKVGLGNLEDDRFKGVVIKHSKQKDLAKYDDKFIVLEPIYPTVLKTLLECPKRYYFEKVLNIQNKEEKDEIFANLFHSAVKEVVDNKEKLKTKDEYFYELKGRILSKAKQNRDHKLLFEILVKWEDRIRKFCEIDFDDMIKSKNMTEEKIEFKLEDRELCAFVDRIDIYGNSIILIDYKTSNNAKKNEEYIYEFQTTFYYLYAKEKFPDKEIKTIIWDIKNGKKIEGNLKIDELRSALKNLPSVVQESKDILVDEKVLKRAVDICRYCDYKIACGRDNE